MVIARLAATPGATLPEAVSAGLADGHCRYRRTHGTVDLERHHLVRAHQRFSAPEVATGQRRTCGPPCMRLRAASRSVGPGTSPIGVRVALESGRTSLT